MGLAPDHRPISSSFSEPAHAIDFIHGSTVHDHLHRQSLVPAEQEHLSDLFAEYGEVKSCSLPLDRETGRKRGFAFVEMVNDADEQKAIDDLQDVEWMGRMIRVSKATPRERSGGPRGG